MDELIFSEDSFQSLGVYNQYKSGNNPKFDDFSQKILKYKKKYLDAIDYFHARLLSEIIPPGDYSICIAPSSNKTPFINGNYVHQCANALLCGKLCRSLNAINASGALIRIEDRKKSHFGGSRDSEGQMNTLSLDSDKLVKGKDIILLDDVITTGHTIQACYKTLMKGNPNRIAIVVLANTPRAKEMTQEEREKFHKLLHELFN